MNNEGDHKITSLDASITHLKCLESLIVIILNANIFYLLLKLLHVEGNIILITK